MDVRDQGGDKSQNTVSEPLMTRLAAGIEADAYVECSAFTGQGLSDVMDTALAAAAGRRRRRGGMALGRRKRHTPPLTLPPLTPMLVRSHSFR